MIGRDTSLPLFIHKETLSCLDKGCIACLYKLSPSGKLGNLTFPPNVRPELCPRSTLNLSRTIESGIYWQTSGESILTCGDGDFTFSLSLSNDASFKTRTEETGFCMTATSHETRESVLKTYGDPTDRTLRILEENGAKVIHGVDATDLESVIELREKKFDKIIWNFPCVGQGLSAGADGQSSEMEENKQLIMNFFRSASNFLNTNGEIHIAHKTIEPFCWWNIHKLGQDSGIGFDCVGSLIFDRMLFPGYVNRKALHKKSFPCHDAQIYVFKRVHAATLPDQAPSRSLSWALSECETLDEGTLARIVEKVKRALQIAQLESKKKQAGKKRKWASK